MLRYVCHNNDVIIDVKTFWRPFLFSWRKKEDLCTKTARIWR